MSDYVSKAQVLETYAELYDVFDDNHKICEVLHAVYEKINNLTPLKEHKNEYENGFNDAMLGKQELMYEGMDGKWHKKDW